MNVKLCGTPAGFVCFATTMFPVAAAATVTGAVGPVGVTETPVVAATALALLKYVPGVDEAVAEKPSVMLPLAGTGNDPLQVSVGPETAGSAVVIPVVEPATYVNPAGNVSVIELRATADAPEFVMVIV